MTSDRASSPLAVALAAFALALAGCGGGGGGNGSDDGSRPGGANVAPIANAGSDRTVTELSTVELNGSATDANAGDTLAYAWAQTGGQAVSIADAGQALATFSAPDVQAGMPEVLTFELTVTDGGGLSDTDSVAITVAEPGQTVTISGTLQYEFVPPRPLCQGLDYPMTERRPIRAATVQVIDAGTGQVIGEDEASENGEYGITIDTDLDVFIRVRAELLRGGTPSWNVEVRDNTSNTTLPLGQRPVYVLDSAAFDSGPLDQQRNLTATTGWDGTAYSSPRAAAPFAILDAIYSAMQLVLEAEPTAQFAPLDAFWSIDNRPTSGSTNSGDEIANGELSTSFYSGAIDSLFLLGAADADTEEFDDHVIVHEWGHYFEDVFSRSDSVGGPHGFGDRLDMRVAFGEGWATALAGIALANPQYCDTQGTSQASGFEIDAEEDSPGVRGWFNEFSVMALIYDLWDDSPAELTRGDNGAMIGFQPIFDTMTGPQRTTASHTSIFSFLSHLVDVFPAAMAPVSELSAYHGINGTGIYGAGETNDSDPNGSPEDVLPVYTEIVPNGTPVNICSNRQFDSDVAGNRLSEYRFLRMTVPTASRYTFNIVTDAETLAKLPPDDPDDDRDQSDPDIWYYLNGEIQNRFVNGDTEGQSGVANRETFTSAIVLGPGNYVMDVLEWRHVDEQTDKTEFPARSCFDVTITPAP